MSFLGFENKTFLVFGLANKKSVAYHVGRILEAEGANALYSVHSMERKENILKLLNPSRDRQGAESNPVTPVTNIPKIFVCDVAKDSEIKKLADEVQSHYQKIDGIVHSLAFANYENFSGKFHEVSRKDFLQAVDVSCYSLIAIANAFKDMLGENAGVVTISISTTQMAAESYGYMAPAKAALDSTVTFLAKSFSRFSKVRFNAVGAGLLKTNSSAGIPNYPDNYLFAEQATFRKKSLLTEEVAQVAAFLLSERSSGINAQTIVVDAGMGKNYFDADIVKYTTQALWPTDK